MNDDKCEEITQQLIQFSAEANTQQEELICKDAELNELVLQLQEEKVLAVETEDKLKELAMDMDQLVQIN